METNQNKLVVAFVLSLVLFIACDSKREYDGFTAIPESGWNKDSVAVFKVPVHSIVQPYDLFLQLRNHEGYTYSNCWLFVDVVTPSGKARRDTVECFLADPTGKWLGSGFGSLYTTTTTWQQGVKFNEHGEYQFRISQGMRVDNLTGIVDVGLRIEKRGE